MKLHEAIRLGAMLRPQATHPFGVWNSCALQAAAEANGVAWRCFGYVSLRRIYPHLRVMDGSCPQCGAKHSLLRVIWHLNDEHHWTREQIADWIETIERAHEAKSEPMTAAVEA